MATWVSDGYYSLVFDLGTGTWTVAGAFVPAVATFDDGEPDPDDVFDAGVSLDNSANPAGPEQFAGFTSFGEIVTYDPDDPLVYYLNVPTGGRDNIVDGSTVSVTEGAPFTTCFLAGTRITTPSGETAIEDLRPGDLVLTAEGRALPIRWVGRQARAARFAHPLRDLPVEVAAGALGGGLPRRALRVSPAHALFVGGVLAQAGALVNGTTIRRMPRNELPALFTYFHIELAAHELLLAEGAPTESFVDNVEPRHFDNVAERAALLGPDVPPIREMDLPRATSARQLPQAVRRLLAEASAETSCPAAA